MDARWAPNVRNEGEKKAGQLIALICRQASQEHYEAMINSVLSYVKMRTDAEKIKLRTFQPWAEAAENLMNDVHVGEVIWMNYSYQPFQLRCPYVVLAPTKRNYVYSPPDFSSDLPYLANELRWKYPSPRFPCFELKPLFSSDLENHMDALTLKRFKAWQTIDLGAPGLEGNGQLSDTLFQHRYFWTRQLLAHRLTLYFCFPYSERLDRLGNFGVWASDSNVGVGYYKTWTRTHERFYCKQTWTEALNDVQSVGISVYNIVEILFEYASIVCFPERWQMTIQTNI